MAGTKKTRAQLVSADNTLIPSGVPDGVIAINHRQSNEDAYTSSVNKLDDKVESQTDLSARTRLGATEDFNHAQGDGKTFVTYNEAQALAGGGTVTSVNGVSPVAGNVAIDTSSDLSTTYFTDKVGITNTNGDGTEILAVGVMNAGVMLPVDKAKIDKYPDTATNGKILQGNGSTYVEVDLTSGATNLSVINRTSTTLDVASDTGTDAELPSANATEAGLMTATDKVKLDKYPSTATNKKILKGNGSTYEEVDEQNIVDDDIFYDKSYWTDATDFDTNATLSFSNGKLSSGSSSATFATYLYPKLNISNSERVAFSATAKVPTITASSFGYSVGRKTINTWYTTPNIYVQIDFYTSQLRIWQNTTKLKEINAQTILVNHIIELIYVQDGNFIKGILINHTTQSKDEISVWGNLGSTKNLMVPNSSRLGVFFNQANFDVLRIQEMNYEAKNAYITFLGDSKTFGYSSGDISLRFANLCASLGITRVSAGDGDRTVELIQALPRVLAKKSTYVVLCIGRNDLASSVLTATWQANYISIVNQIEATGAVVIHLIGIGETTQDQTALINFVESTYDSSKIINVSAGWVNGTMLSADNIHPNEVGMMYIAKQIKDSGKIPQGYLTPPNLNRFNEFPSAIPTRLDLYEAGGVPLHISTSNADSGAWLGSVAADNIIINAGKKWNGINYINKAATNGGLYFASAEWGVEIDTGKTVGSNTPSTTVLSVSALSLLLKTIDLRLVNPTKGIYLKTGTGQQAGTATLVSGTITITNATITANSIVQATYKTASGTLGFLQVTLTAGASFTINSLDSAGALNTADNSTIYYTIVHNY